MSATRGWYANVESEGTDCSVGPFTTAADADLFRAMMFNCPVGATAREVTGRRMTVRGFQDSFRADFTSQPPARWHARY